MFFALKDNSLLFLYTLKSIYMLVIECAHQTYIDTYSIFAAIYLWKNAFLKWTVIVADLHVVR